MINRISIHDDVELIFAKDECSYTEVINDFSNAQIIKIVTYNISSENSKLIKEISKLADKKEIDIITNIPNRYVSYYSEYARKRARKNIISYTKQLNPEKFESKVSSYFNFNNHSKIILTENIAYIGSANASNESCNNYECGVIIKDKKAIKEINDNIIPILKDDSLEYYGNNYSRITILLINLLTKLKSLHEDFHMSFYDISDHRGANLEYYDHYNADLSPIVLESIENCVYEYDEILEELNESDDVNISLLTPDNIDSIKELIFDLEPFARFDVDDQASKYLSEDPEAYDENLDNCANDAFQRANDERAEKAEEIEEIVVKFEKELDLLIKNIQDNFELFCQNRILNNQIDNT
ncbi:hypothetical protein EXM65_18335 [Clostridium botulinum]|uniref:PLD phosphodiesterase domain-containing protein n=1 Tax=Clostridium botulinum TaxID=1491 RepID=A0A6M0SUH2_CLOBO|nr:hypothetical protein [Clostridium botulinum]